MPKESVTKFLVESMQSQDPVLVRVSAIRPLMSDSVFNLEAYAMNITYDRFGYPYDITFRCRRGTHVEPNAKLVKGKGRKP